MAVNKEICAQEFGFLMSFVQKESLDEESCRNQLRALWTAYCIHKNLDVDTALYDEDMLHLWSIVRGSGCNTLWENAEQFDAFLCQDLV